MASFSESEVASALSRAATKLGYSTLLPQQERVVRAFVQGRDVFVSLPTGSGKSLCYCLLPYFRRVVREPAEEYRCGL